MAIENISPLPTQGSITVDDGWIRANLNFHDPEGATFLSSKTTDQARLETMETAARIGLRSMASADHSYTERLLDEKLDTMVVQLGLAAATTLDKASAAFEEQWAKRVDEDLAKRLDAHGKAIDGRLEVLFGDASDKSVQERVRKSLAEYNAKVKQEIEEDRVRLRRELSELINGTDNPDHPLVKIQGQLNDIRKDLAAELEAARASAAAQHVRKASALGGHDYQADVYAILAEVLRGTDDEVDLKGRSPGATGGADGDVVITIDPALTSGVQARVAVEVTKQASGLSVTKIKGTLKKSKEDRAAQVAVLVIRDPAILGGQRLAFFPGLGVVAVYEPEDPDEYRTLALMVALKHAKAVAIREARPAAAERDDGRIERASQKAKEALEVVDTILGAQSKIVKAAEGTCSAAKELRRTVMDALEEIDEAVAGS
ncbi:MAG TPA: hypothetical protein VGK17_05265 [Propionicimonas sp.]|jgi:hypothetical protein